MSIYVYIIRQLYNTEVLITKCRKVYVGYLLTLANPVPSNPILISLTYFVFETILMFLSSHFVAVNLLFHLFCIKTA
jgi:hypothetical protein